MGEALLFGLAARLGDRFTAEAAQAWSKAYSFISATMVSFSSRSAPRQSCTVM